MGSYLDTAGSATRPGRGKKPLVRKAGRRPPARNLRRSREKKVYFVFQLPGSEILRSRSISYARISTGLCAGFGLFLALIFFTLLDASRAATNPYPDDFADPAADWVDAERSEHRSALRREMLRQVDLVERLVDNQKQIRLLLATENREVGADLDWMETSLGSIDELRAAGADDGPREFGAAAFAHRRLAVHDGLLESSNDFTLRFREMFGSLPHRWPLARDELVINSPFGWRRQPFYRWSKNLKFHNGIDLDAERGDPVVAAAAGRVSRVSHSGTGYGKLVQLSHVDGYETLYAHLNRIQVRKGDHIRAGQLIGRAGSTGYSTGPHLHYEVRRHGKAVDPAKFLAL